MDKIIIHTDGGSRGNPGVGGWGVLLEYGGHQKTLKGFVRQATNNKMELMAAVKALEAVKTKNQLPIEIYSDSDYLVKGMNEWLSIWKKRKWKTSEKKPVKNLTLWKKLDAFNQKFSISWFWVKGHSNHPGNDTADRLANEAMDEAEKNRPTKITK